MKSKFHFVLLPLLAVALCFTGGCGKPRKTSKARPAPRRMASGASAQRSGAQAKPKAVQVEEISVDIGEGCLLTFVKTPGLAVWVGKYEVTNKQFRRFKPEHDSGSYKGFSLNESDQPAVKASWQDAQDFCAFLNKNYNADENRRYVFRLPTEEEWETYAQCGAARRFPWGDSPQPPADWNYFGEENKQIGPKLRGHNDGYVASAPVTRSGRSDWGLFGVGGNVWEWCEDAYDETGKSRVYRGGSWSDMAPLFLEVGRRSSNEQNYRFINIGFRLAAEAAELTEEEKELIAAQKKAEEERLAAEKARKEEEEKLKQAELAAMAERDRLERREMEKMGINRLMAEGKYEEAGEALEKYAAMFEKDSFYEKTKRAAENTKVLNLGEGAVMELVRIEPLKLWVGKCEVSNRQFRRFRPEHSSGMFRDYDMNGDEQPVVQVSWEDAQDFCKWLTDNFGRRPDGNYEFRLPAEEEWTVFAKCGDSRVFPWGSDWPPKYGNYGRIDDYEDEFLVSCSVEESGENEWGLFGVGGNVWEWSQDWYDSAQQYHLFKGGAWNLAHPDALRIDNRGGDAQAKRNSYIGFRVVMSPAAR